MARKSVAEAICKQFTDLGEKVITVPEWDDLEIHHTPYTLQERSQLVAWQQNLPKNAGPLLIYAKILIKKAKEVDGKPAFEEMDFKLLTEKADPDVVIRVAQEITGELEDVDDEGEQGAIKNT